MNDHRQAQIFRVGVLPSNLASWQTDANARYVNRANVSEFRKNARWVVHHAKIWLWVALAVAVTLSPMTACKGREPVESKSISLMVQRDSIVDFHRFLEALKLLVSPQGISLEISIEPNGKRLSFSSLNGFPGEPVTIHVTPNDVAISTGASRVQLTLDELQRRLADLAAAASKANYKATVMLVSDRQVSGDFGLSILKTISEAGIATIMLSDPEIPAVTVPFAAKKTSSPVSRSHEAETE